MKKLFLFLLFNLIILHSFSQTAARVKESNGARKWSISASFGFSVLGPGEDVRSQMISSGFDDTSPESWFGGPVSHPFIVENPVYDLEATYYFNETMGVSINYGLVNHVEINGYDDDAADPFGNYLFLNSKISSVSLNYHYCLLSQVHNFIIGPALVIHNIKDVSAGNNSPANENIKVGVNLGYFVKVLNRKHWFLGLKTNYRWAPASEIGPFSEDASSFPATKVNIATLNFGVTAGAVF